VSSDRPKKCAGGQGEKRSKLGRQAKNKRRERRSANQEEREVKKGGVFVKGPVA